MAPNCHSSPRTKGIVPSKDTGASRIPEDGFVFFSAFVFCVFDVCLLAFVGILCGKLGEESSGVFFGLHLLDQPPLNPSNGRQGPAQAPRRGDSLSWKTWILWAWQLDG